MQLAVSLLTTLYGYSTTLAILTGWVILTCLAEYAWVQVVYRQLPALSLAPVQLQHLTRAASDGSGGEAGVSRSSVARNFTWFEQQKADWAEFMRMPIFASTSPPLDWLRQQIAPMKRDGEVQQIAKTRFRSGGRRRAAGENRPGQR